MHPTAPMRRSSTRQICCSHRRLGGFSFTEVLVTIAIIGIISAIAVPAISRTDKVSKDEVANQVVTSMNRAVMAYRQCGSEFVTVANGDSGADELSILTLLTLRDPGVVGSPFLQGTQWPSVETADPGTYRVIWNGRFFEVLAPGAAGTGLKINGI